MVEPLTDLDRLLLSRWVDTVGMWDAIKEMEDRLADRLEWVVEQLRPWFEDLGYVLIDVDRKYAGFYIAKSEWLDTKGDALAFVGIGGLYPIGFRKVSEEHPYVVIRCDLAKTDQERFKAELAVRLKDAPGNWINDECSRRTPAIRNVESHGDSERLKLAQDDTALADFIKTELGPLLLLGHEVDAALAVVSK